MMTVSFRNRPTARQPVLRYAGVASAIGISLVVFGHSLPPHLTYPADDNVANLNNWVVKFIYTFHMPLFFFISGYLYVYTNPNSRHRSYIDHVRGKAIRLLIPYVVLGTVAFAPKVILAEYANNPIEASWFFYFNTLLYPWNNSVRFFWFLPTLFAMITVAPVLLVCLRIENTIWARSFQLGLFVVLIWLNLSFEHYAEPPTLLNYTGILHNAFYFWFGMWMYHLLGEQISRRENNQTLQNLALGAGAFGMSIAIFTWLEYSALTALLNASLGIVAIFSFSLAIAGMTQNVLRLLDRFSYQIYLLSFFFQVPTQLMLYHYLGAPSSIVLIASFIAGLVGPIVCARLLLARYLPGKLIVGL